MTQTTEQLFPQARIGPDGTLSFPHRGDPPKSIQGYKKVDSHTFRPIVGFCKHRTTTWKKVCGGMIQTLYCSKFAINIRTVDCLVCDAREEK